MMTFQRVAAFTFIVGTSFLAGAEELPRAKTAEDVGFSTERLQRLASALREGVEEGDLPGAAVVIGRRGMIAFAESFGFRDSSTRKPMGLDSIHWIASLTKPVATVALMMLVEEGKLSLADPVHFHVPEFEGLKVAVEDASGAEDLRLESPLRPMTVLDLLRHTSGLTDDTGESLINERYRAEDVWDESMTSAEMIAKLAKLPLQYHPGTTWEYGVSTNVVGYIVEVVSGVDLNRFMTDRLLKPLAMNDTGFWVPPEKADRIAHPQEDPTTGVRPDETATSPSRWFSGAGGMVSTARDYARFCQFLLNGGQLGGVRLLSTKTIEYMTSDHLPPGIRINSFPTAVIDIRPESGQSFGLGFAVRVHPGRSAIPGSVGDYSWVGGSGTYFWIDPEEEMFVVMMAQISTARLRAKYWTMVRNLVYQALTD